MNKMVAASLLLVTAQVLAACAPGEVPASMLTGPRGTADSAEARTPMPPGQDTRFPGPAVSEATPSTASVSLCPGAASPAQPQAHIRLTANPNPVSGGQTLTYCIEFTSTAAYEVAPSLLIHLPTGGENPKTSGAGWICETSNSPGDSMLPRPHTDVSCTSAIVTGHAAALPSLFVITSAPRAPGQLTACAQVKWKDQLEDPVCVTVDVNQAPPP